MITLEAELQSLPYFVDLKTALVAELKARKLADWNGLDLIIRRRGNDLDAPASTRIYLFAYSWVHTDSIQRLCTIAVPNDYPALIDIHGSGRTFSTSEVVAAWGPSLQTIATGMDTLDVGALSTADQYAHNHAAFARDEAKRLIG